MAKLTRAEYTKHEKVMTILSQKTLSREDKRFVFENYREDALHVNSAAGAFFTPMPLASDFALHIPRSYRRPVKVLDLCAGIGVLTQAAIEELMYVCESSSEFTCVEINRDYVEAGRILVPEATWYCADALDPSFLSNLGRFDCVISNPPFGHVNSEYRRIYSSGHFEYMIIEAASRISDYGVFLIPQMSAPFIYSGTNAHRYIESLKLKNFTLKTGLELEFGLGVDTSQYADLWHGIRPVCEIICCDFSESAARNNPMQNTG